MTAVLAPDDAGAAGSERAMRHALRPVEDGVLDRARRRARAVDEAAEHDARRILAAARADADAVIERARLEGEEAGAHAAASTLVEARAEARALVLSAKRRAFEALRSAVLDELARRSDTPEVAALGRRLTAMALARLGDTAVVRRPGPGVLDIVVEAGRRRAVVTPEALVDGQLARMADEVEGLWA